MRAFFVDDDESVNFFHGIIVEEYGGFEECEFYDNPMEALDRLAQLKEEESPNVLFLDINMPPIDGWEFLDELNERNLHIPIISIVSTSMNPEDKIRAQNHPLVSYFQSKPLTVEFLKKVKEAYLGDSPSISD